MGAIVSWRSCNRLMWWLLSLTAFIFVINYGDSTLSSIIQQLCANVSDVQICTKFVISCLGVDVCVEFIAFLEKAHCLGLCSFHFTAGFTYARVSVSKNNKARQFLLKCNVSIRTTMLMQKRIIFLENRQLFLYLCLLFKK